MFCAYAVKFYTLDDSLMFILTRVPPSAEPSPTNTPTSTANLQNTPNATTGSNNTAPYTNSAFTAAYSTTRPAHYVSLPTTPRTLHHTVSLASGLGTAEGVEQGGAGSSNSAVGSGTNAVAGGVGGAVKIHKVRSSPTLNLQVRNHPS